jgi:predicted amidohydrolase YtcJ
MLEPYSDKPSSSGSLLVNATTLSKLTCDWATAGYQVNIHAIGDLANRLAIDAFEAAYRVLCPTSSPRDCQAKHRFRIEHSQIVHPDDQRRMMEYGVIPSIQPTHATSDMVRYVHKRRAFYACTNSTDRAMRRADWVKTAQRAQHTECAPFSRCALY